MQNGKVLTTRIQGCVVNGAARGDLSSEKVYVKLARMTCDQPGGRVAVSEVKGFISFAGKSGVRGRVVSREGSLVSQGVRTMVICCHSGRVASTSRWRTAPPKSMKSPRID